MNTILFNMKKYNTPEKLSRNKSIKLPRTIKNDAGPANTCDDLFSIYAASATGFDTKFDNSTEYAAAQSLDTELNRISKISPMSSDLLVITQAKKLGAYIMAITIKSPQKFRATYISRMQNLCLESIECMYQANSIIQNSVEAKNRREAFQTNAIIKLKMLGYISLLAQNASCILLRQYKQIAIMLGDAINLCTAWRKSDNGKWGLKQTKQQI